MAGMYLRDTLERKYPHAHLDWDWQYEFVAGNYSTDPRGGV